ncbi:TonB-dependent receptor [Paucibacter sp. R3-3]|uniref:TonB-dependent receptor n=1 Tax=Roseateles agri TaxID=3098619 RepID=A0ABU5DCC9_9BURK|nr:TonB-dependent receptor [Paucibacter sp. R3-3]MDY0743936.1 TonB-dependent receptor [Paucibacter sp. R3-3]
MYPPNLEMQMRRSSFPPPVLKLRKLATLLAPCLSALCAPAAWAQQAGGDAPAASKPAEARDTLDVVTVTATRRREPLRDVPLRVETLSATALEQSGANSLADYIGGLPGIDVKTDGGPGRGSVTMRGVSNGEQQIATVGMYVDEVAFGSSSAFVHGGVQALDLSLLDLNHVEVLRGPQGTLYGAGAMGGLLKYVTNEPDTSTFSGKVGLGVRSIQDGGIGHTENVVLNVPLSTDVAGLRIAAFNEHDGGFIRATGLAAGDKTNAGDTRGARLSLLLEPTSKMKVRLAATTQDIKRDGTDTVDYDATTGRPVVGDLARALATREPYTVKTRLVSADVEYDFGWARLNAIASTQRLDMDTAQDATALLGASAAAFDYARLDNTIGLHKKTQELRLTSGRGEVEWILGLYHDEERGNVGQLLFGQLAGNGGDMDLQANSQPSTYRETAVYGDITWNIGTAWSLTAGARFAKNKQHYAVVGAGPLDSDNHSDDDSKTYLATLRYSLDKTSSVYFRAASGYRPGGPNPPALDGNLQVIPGTPSSFNHDTLWSFELGYKADLLDRRLNLEAALYQINWNDLQQPMAYGVSTLVGNAGKARVRGLELAARYRASADWDLNGSLAYTDPKLTEDAPALGPAGSRLPNVAKIALTAGLRYSFPLAGHESYAGLNLRHVGQRNAGFDAEGSSVPNFSLPAYTMVDANWGLDLGRWQVSAFIRNLTNKQALLGADTALTAFGLPLHATVAQPRTIGGTVSFNF